MSRARKIARPGALSYQSLERSRGTFAPIDPDRHYIVEPGEPGNAVTADGGKPSSNSPKTGPREHEHE